MTSNCDKNLKRNVKNTAECPDILIIFLVSSVIDQGPLAVRTATPRKTSIQKWIKILSRNFATDWMCLPSLTTPLVNLSIKNEGGVEFQIETEVICR